MPGSIVCAPAHETLQICKPFNEEEMALRREKLARRSLLRFACGAEIP
jgi:hypothetical protein